MSQESLLRDQLARERTIMANERTLLAYGRTVLGLLGLAVVIFKFSDPTFGVPVSMTVLIATCALLFWGIRSYRLANTRINGEEQALEALALVETD